MHLLRKMLRIKVDYPSFDAKVCSNLSPLQWFERSLHKSVVRSKCRRKVIWIDQAENLCQMYVDFSYIDRFLGFG